MRRGHWLSATFLLLLPATVAAQQDTSTAVLPDIVVSEGRVPLPAHAVTEAVTVLSGATLRAEGLHLVQDALREVPGFAVVQQGSFGGVTSVFARGGESDYVKVFVDGIAVNEPGGAFDLASLTLDDVERIEVVRGPASVTYGSDAVTGVVRIFTQRGGGPLHGSVEGRMGTLGTTDGQARAAGQLGAARWSVGASAMGSDGSYAFNNRFSNAGLTARLGLRPDARSDASLTARVGGSTSHFPTDGAGVPSDSNQFTRDRSTVLGLEGGRQLSGSVELRASAAYAWHRLGFTDQPDGPSDTLGFGYASERQSRSIRWNVDGRVIARPSLRSMISAGLQFERQLLRTAASYTSNFGDGSSSSSDPVLDRGRNSGAAYVEGRADLARGLVLTSGARIEQDQAFGTFATWRAGLRRDLSGGFSIRASAGTGFKAPTFAENYANSPFEVGNPGLQPERSSSWESAVEYEDTGSNLKLTITYFDQRFHDLIQYVGASAGEPTYQNLGAALARGAELSLEARLVRGWQGGLTGTWLETRVTDAGASSSPAFADGSALIRRPAASGAVWLRGTVGGRVHLDTRFSHVGPRDDVDFSAFPGARVRLQSYSLLAAAIDVEVLPEAGARPGVSLLLRGDNLLGEQYETVRGFPGLGRTVIAGARLAW